MIINDKPCGEIIKIGSDKNCHIVINEEIYKLPVFSVLFNIHLEDCNNFCFYEKKNIFQIF